MIKVRAKIRAKDEESLEAIREVIEQYVNSIPIQVGDYLVFGAVPLEFKGEIIQKRR